MESKYIIIPEYAPLYAMSKCFGPLRAPLTKPTLTPIDIIGLLLNQSGSDKVTIYEVKKLDNDTFSEPVKLNKANYAAPYDSIITGDSEPGEDTSVATTKVNTSDYKNDESEAVVSPEIVESDDSAITTNAPVVSEDESTTDESESVNSTTSTATITKTSYTGMTKAERRAARAASLNTTTTDTNN